MNNPNQSKIFEKRIELANTIESLKNEGKKIVFTNGCFDILHSGHVIFLNEAKELGDILVIGVNTDENIRKLKGITRPINNLEERLIVLSAVNSVDYIIVFTENTPSELISELKPDICAQGGDYEIGNLPEATTVKEIGSEMIILPYLKNHSTTLTIKKIKDSFRQAMYFTGN
jgi:D-beta-D-heptose 7-phosphate kinase / D-beta-D-heptose 1-phosphate adenosyltransferase